MTERRLRFEIGSLVVPGDRLGPARSEFEPGPGTVGGDLVSKSKRQCHVVDDGYGCNKPVCSCLLYVSHTVCTLSTSSYSQYLRQGQLYASVTGRLHKHKKENVRDDDDHHDKQQPRMQRTMLSVINARPFLQQAVLTVGQVVLAKVTRIALQHQAVLEIVATEHGPLRYTHEAILRSEDIWPKEQLLQLQSRGSSDTSAFRSGDLMVARILSLGDTRRYILTTAEPALGVIHALSAKSGLPMVPSSWNEMQCPHTGFKETRKCAKPTIIAAVDATL